VVHLYTFLISHFSEKVRFALDLGGIAYEERALLPGPHILTVRRIARRTSVPLLVHEGEPGRDRTIVQGSSLILDYAEAQLGLASSDLSLAASSSREPSPVTRSWSVASQAHRYSTRHASPRRGGRVVMRTSVPESS